MSSHEGKRFVVDTNVLISHPLMPSSAPGKALQHALRTGELLVSDTTLTELAEVLNRPKFDKYLSNQKRKKFLKCSCPYEFVWKSSNPFMHAGILIMTNSRSHMNGSADFILSGDKDLLVLHPFHD